MRRLFDKGERVAALSRNVICSSELPLLVGLLVLLRVAHADEDVGDPGEKFSWRLRVSLRGLRRINSLFLQNVFAPDFFGTQQ